jgi:very-short-patch-repair endonuclease
VLATPEATSGTPRRGEVLVAILPEIRDLDIARERRWYRIPVSSVKRFLKERWPPEWLAFYQPKVFGREAFGLRYYARVLGRRQVFRHQLFPDEPINKKTNKQYYQVMLGPMEELPQPILARRLRRIVFIPTTWTKLISAAEINDLYDESPLEDRLWAELKRLKMQVERQFFVPVGKRKGYFLDFAVFCNAGKLDVETDGDTWHIGPSSASEDNERDNELTSKGWDILRFRGQRIREQMADYCIPKITETVNRLGGLKANGLVPRPFDPERPEAQQLTLFEPGPEYDLD